MKKYYLEVINCAIEAGKEIMKIYLSEDFGVSYKEDNSPLTLADKKSNEVIMQTLNKIDIPIISEENKEIIFEDRKNWSEFWLVDPLDGTKEFINRRGDFTVNIALIKDNKPVFGVIYVPAKEKLYFGSIEIGSYKKTEVNSTFDDLEKLKTACERLPIEKNDDVYRVIASKSHFNKETEDFIENLKSTKPNMELINVGSSLKLCSIADGTADIYPRFGPTMEWDIAAGHAIVKSAGGKVIQAENKKEVVYNKENLLNPYFIVSM
ncbi:MAG: 3'(2'),5'-bisphosphate nucleotidase CysQ [Bacteroidales bacterium]|nr:3'(2'),5'-bisphosphate nucleotidase CysQ [Bacteroidales bacterium]